MKPVLLMLLLLLHAGAHAQVRRDPFARPAAAVVAPAAVTPDAMAAPPAPPAPPRLRAIMYEPGKSLVNINGRILALGEQFEDYRVTAIQPGSATLTRRGVRSILVLSQESSK